MSTARVVLDGAHDGAENLARDEALLESRGLWLRFYAWEPATISLGYFQRYADFASLAGRYPIVRRCTGGGAILHENELTFAICGDASLLPRRVEESYARLNRAVQDATALRGSELLPAQDSGRDSIWCFEAPRGLDLADARGVKVVGSAQRRRDGRFLHHGSIVLGAALASWTWQSLAEALTTTIAASLGARAEAREMPEATLERARTLVAERYGREDWQQRR